MLHFTHGHTLVIGAGGDLPGAVVDAEGLAAILTDSERCSLKTLSSDQQSHVESIDLTSVRGSGGCTPSTFL